LNTISLTNNVQTQDDYQLQQELIAKGHVPQHIAVIMDGNGRWAKSRGSLRLFGHKAGVESVRDITEACAQIGVKYLTLYAFSTENWGRPSDEVLGLMQILVQSIRNETKKLNKNNIRLITIGQTERFPESCQRELNEAIEITKNNTRLSLCLALSYSGRWDITQAVKKIARKVQAGTLDPEAINDELITAELETALIPDPDLIIRTSGEFRISNFLLWQLAYSELYVTQTFWPDFRRNELYEAIHSYQQRERRYGKISEQVTGV
jgi:undecaprenyl diphosphate synthase